MDEIRIEGVRLTSPERVLFPDQGITKRRLAEYCVTVAGAMLPHLRGRPVSLLRCPQGEEKACFFQRHPGAGLSGAIRSIEIVEKAGDPAGYLVIDDLAGILSAVQMGTLEFHIWGCRADDVERPDRMVFDLDPDKDLAFANVRDAAFELKALLDGLDLASFPMLTGGKGIHLVLPLQRRQSWPDLKEFSHGVAEALVRRSPDRFTTNMRKEARGGKIFVDYLRNERASTAIAPWSTRAHARAPVAMPVSWNELALATRSDAFTIADAPGRLKADPWPDYETIQQSVSRAISTRLDGLG
ncbi:MAG TPA: non-homologous end-joining DNA ligase [Geminicoccaceae bacterium]|nr:non-homologous end-joining DNA ligase [Geminicoccus sp.]HMU53143.1 non-homologous end-joining DNA ligase [Geminicoccaceae bacterium]